MNAYLQRVGATTATVDYDQYITETSSVLGWTLETDMQITAGTEVIFHASPTVSTSSLWFTSLTNFRIRINNSASNFTLITPISTRSVIKLVGNPATNSIDVYQDNVL